MHITKLKIEHFEGIESLEIEPSTLTILSGRNGAGKTSVLEAVRAAITNRPERSRLVHDGEGQGMILFELSDGTHGERRVTNSGRTAGGVRLTRDTRISSPQSALDKLTRGFGFNPVEFLSLDESEQREEILRVTDVHLPMKEAIRLSAGKMRDDVTYDAHPLVVLKQIEESLYYHRRDVNRDARKLRSAAEKMRESVEGEEIDKELLRNFDLEEAIARLTRAQDVEGRITKKERRRGEVKAQIEALQQELGRLDNELVELRAQRVDPDPIRADIEAYKRDQDAWRTLQDANDKDAEAEGLETRSEALTALIEETRAKPAELLQSAELPVKGLGIDAGGNITINGLPVSELSTGEKLMLATDIAIATLPSDGLRIVLVDGLEQLDPGNRAAMMGKLARADVQVLATEVGEGELTVITDYEVGSPDSEEYPPAQKKQDDDIPF
jgi:recombinational DNA repair ATPase RecF